MKKKKEKNCCTDQDSDAERWILIDLFMLHH